MNESLIKSLIKITTIKILGLFIAVTVIYAGDTPSVPGTKVYFINIKDVSMADAEEVKNQSGFSIGGVSPIGHLKKINILVDISLSRFENIYAAAGHPHSIFKTTYKQLLQLTDGKEEDIV